MVVWVGGRCLRRLRAGCLKLVGWWVYSTIRKNRENRFLTPIWPPVVGRRLCAAAKGKVVMESESHGSQASFSAFGSFARELFPA